MPNFSIRLKTFVPESGNNAGNGVPCSAMLEIESDGRLSDNAPRGTRQTLDKAL